MSTSIVVVEDESSIAEVLQYNLERAGYDVSTEVRGDDALERIRATPPDLLLLDLMLPGLDGFEVLKSLRRDPRTAQLPTIVLTARTGEGDRIVGLELGADDYITKPFSPREVVLRVKSVLRRVSGAAIGEVLDRGGLRLDIAGHRLELEGEEVALTPTEFKLVKLLMEREGQVLAREQLLTQVWGYSGDVDSRTVDTHVRRLRRKLGPCADRLQTVVGVGYRFRADGPGAGVRHTAVTDA